MSPTKPIPIDLAKLLQPHTGQWVTLSHDETRVVGHGKTIDEALSQAKKAGEDHPVLVKSPDSRSVFLL